LNRVDGRFKFYWLNFIKNKTFFSLRKSYDIRNRFKYGKRLFKYKRNFRKFNKNKNLSIYIYSRFNKLIVLNVFSGKRY
jgi:hypothetical protein